MSDIDRSNELTWTAFRYISDEMSAEETEAFELQLADDQSARDAVARAVQLSVTVAAALPQPMSSRAGESATPARRRRLLAAASTVCALLLLAVLFQTWFAPSDTSPSQTTESNRTALLDGSNEAGQLVSLWVSADGEADDAIAGNDATIPTDNDDPQSDSDLADDARDGDLIVPGWMIAAVFHDVDDDDSEFENAQETN